MRQAAWMIMAVLAAGCALPSASGHKTGGAPSGNPGIVGTAAKNPGLAPAAKALDRRLGIVNAIQNTLVAGDLARSQNTIQLISDNGLGLISDNGLGLVSNNGGGLISDNGLGYRIRAANPDVYYENTALTTSLAWHTVFFKPDYHGEIKAYDKAEYQAKGDAATYSEYYTWGALGIDFKNPTFPIQFPVDARLTYKITPVKTKRFGFIKTMTLKFDLSIKSMEPPPAKVQYNDFTGSYAMEVPLADGTKAVLTMDTYDLTYAPGQGMGGGVFYAPQTFKAKGANEGGSLDMSVERVGDPAKEDVATNIKATHTAKGSGQVSKLELAIADDGSSHSVVTDVDNGVEALMDFAADRTGKGAVRNVQGQESLGTIAWGPDGLGTITFSDGTTAKVRVF